MANGKTDLTWLWVILIVLASLFSIYKLAMWACSLSCLGKNVAANLVFFGGITLVIAATYFLLRKVRRLYGSKNKRGENPKKADNNAEPIRP